jgi:hypothetical protein
VRSADSELALSNALSEISAVYISSDIDPATKIERTYPVSLPFIRAHHLMMLCTKFGFLDLFSYVPSFPEADIHDFYNSAVLSDGFRYTSLDWLRKMKIAAGRTKDLTDLEKLKPE